MEEADIIANGNVSGWEIKIKYGKKSVETDSYALTDKTIETMQSMQTHLGQAGGQSPEHSI